ncbi:armadillo-like helical domain-containing protein 3 isoform X2 [Chrysoperla carnea]|uniref:armadillo-like helical domain-containing protein 3 isoform X2 n=1 Tax=Chrysoperla carnea TaxID=189513 RepID=UPI001D08B06E|nr:armadillo-like helical domain-containing protein 3 isoform X2 [Chrysoperla carnea]
MTTRKRSGSGSKRQLKEKVVQIYESFLKGDDLEKTNPTFWDELFLLKPKVVNLENEIQKLNSDQLVALKENINSLFWHCIETLGHEHHIRVVYALQTLCALVNSIYKKTAMENGFDVINILMGFDVAEERMQLLLTHINVFLTGEFPNSLKQLCLKLLLVFVTGTENVSSNTVLEYVMATQTFESLMQLLRSASSRQMHGYDVLLLLTLLVNYRKHEVANPYIVKLSIVDDELALNGYGQVITASLQEFCREFVSQQYESQSASWLSSLTNIVGNIFLSEEGGIRTQQIRANNALLLALYEAIHLNRNFITTLAATQTDAGSSAGSAPPSPGNTLTVGSTAPDPTRLPIDIMAQPSNLLVTFLQYCSIVMQDTKTEASTNTVKLCFVILGCISEDQYANTIMHDVTLCFKVIIHRLPMRHRKIPPPDRAAPSQPLAATLLAIRYSTGESELRENAARLNTALTNVKAIIKHFAPKIEQWLNSQALSTPSEDQILEVVRKNYDSLTLKLQDSLDQYERYSEKPKHAAFFTNMVRSVVQDTKQTLDFASMDLQVILQDFSSIS